MTISNTTRKAGPYNGNGVTTVFPFTFKVFDKTNIQVLKVDGNGISTPLVLDSDYSVLLNTDQNGSPGGSITYPITGTALATGYQLVMLGDLPYDQETDLTNQGGFYPQVIEDMADRATIQIQQLEEITSRAIVVSPSESLNPVLPTAKARAGTVLGFDSLGGVTLLPQPSTLGGGNMRTDVFRSANGDFVPGTTRVFTLSRDPGSADNLWAWWDNAQQFDFALTGTTLTFNDPIDANVTVVRIRIGTVLSTYTPSAGSVGDSALQFGDLLPRCFTSIANLRATNDVRYRVAFVTGYYAPHDGGGGPYVIDAADTTSADNGGSIIVDAIGRRWKLNTGPDWYVEQFGGGGIGGGGDDAVYINKAIAALPDRGGTVRLLGKQYNVSSGIVIGNGDAGANKSTKNGVRLIGMGGGFGTAGPAPTVIQAAAAISGAMLTVAGAITDVRLQGFKLYANLQAQGCLYLTASSGTQIENVTGNQYLNFGMWWHGGNAPTGNYNINNQVNNCFFASTANGHTGLFMDGNASVFNDTWLTSFNDCRFDTTSAINSNSGYFAFVDNVTFSRCHFVGDNVAGVGKAGCYGAYFNAVGNNAFPAGLAFKECSIISTFVNETTDKIGIISLTNFGVDDYEHIPTHANLRGFTVYGHPFNGWGT